MLSVSQLNEQAKTLLESHFKAIEIQGEISRLTRHASGHWYFTLKDEGAAVSAVMFRGANSKVGFDVVEGAKVVALASVSMYVPSGSYQLIVQALRPEGAGELELALERLKNKLKQAGLFDASRKKPIPRLPRKIGVITSATSAALADMLRVADARWQLSEICIFDSLTQGLAAPQALIKALKRADEYGCDVLILARGGGSKEDLWCFNDEELAICISNLKTPLITGIGHEIDESVADLVADLSAPTPTAAMHSALPDAQGVAQYLDRLHIDIKNIALKKLELSNAKLKTLKAGLSPTALIAKINTKQIGLKALSQRLDSSLQKHFLILSNKADKLKASFKAYESFLKSTKGLVQIFKDGKRITSLSQLSAQDSIVISAQDGKKQAIIKE